MSWAIFDFVEKLANYPRQQELRLAEAVANNDVTETEKLLRKGIDPNMRIVGKCLNPLIFLAFQKNFFTLPASSAYDLEPNLYEIVPKTECLRCLLEYGADPNVRDNFGKTVLDIAIVWCLPDTVKLLLEYGADVRSCDRQGVTPLIKTVILGIKDARSMADKLQISQYLLDFGADINAQTLAGKTALMYAVSNYRLEMIEFLLAKGASLSITDNQGKQAGDLIPKSLNSNRYSYLAQILSQPQFNSDIPISPEIELKGDRYFQAT